MSYQVCSKFSFTVILAISIVFSFTHSPSVNQGSALVLTLEVTAPRADSVYHLDHFLIPGITDYINRKIP